jgi:hypothetical protein
VTPFCVDNGPLVLVLDGDGVTPELCRRTAEVLRRFWASVTDARPFWMRPGDYLTVWVGRTDWQPGVSGWSNVRLRADTPRYTPQVIHVAVPDERWIAHEFGHCVLTGSNADHEPEPGFVMSSPPGRSWRASDIQAGWANRRAYLAGTVGGNRWQDGRPADAGWAVERLPGLV